MSKKTVLLLFFSFLGLVVAFFLVKDNIYENATLKIRLIDEDYDCDFVGSLYVIDAVFESDNEAKTIINSIVLPVFKEEDSFLYKEIHANTFDSLNVRTKKAVITAEGRLAMFANVDDWYGCTGSKKIKIEKVLQAEYVLIDRKGY